MRLTRTGPGQFREMPWKNGRGSTTELMIEPPGATLAGGFLWRLSMADVTEDGPFSPFPGLDRTLLLLEGNGLELDHGIHGRVLLPGPLVPAAFSGDWPTRGRLLDGPCRDFNVMSDRRLRHLVLVLRPGPEPAFLPAAETLLVYPVRGSVWVRSPECRVAAGELLRIDPDGAPAPAVSALEAGTVLVVVAIRPALPIEAPRSTQDLS